MMIVGYGKSTQWDFQICIIVGKAADVNALCAEAMAIGPEHDGER
jgi:hypothetical protein